MNENYIYKVSIVPDLKKNITSARKNKLKSVFYGFEFKDNGSSVVLISDPLKIRIETSTITLLFSDFIDIDSIQKYISFIFSIFEYNYTNNKFNFECSKNIFLLSENAKKENLIMQTKAIKRLVDVKADYEIMPTRFEFLTDYKEKFITLEITIHLNGLKVSIAGLEDEPDKLNSLIQLIKDFSNDTLFNNIIKILLGDEGNGK